MIESNLELERIGTVGFNKQGSKMIVEEYNHCDDITVRFIEHGNRVHTRWMHFTKGNVCNIHDRTVYGTGYIGEGEYKPSANNKNTEQYDIWNAMLQRCYSEKYHATRPTYKECIVTEEWHSFQNFAKWYDQNYYEIDGERMALDKDILVKGNKIYSPDTCVFVPASINSLFLKRNKNRGSLPIGVFYKENRKLNKYGSRCNNGEGKQIHLGYFKSPEEAFLIYKQYKEELIKQIADEYFDKIPSKLYNAMINYKVEIND